MAIVGELFKKEDFIAAYIQENIKQITESYLVVVRTLRRLGVPYTPSRGSLFIWADFSAFSERKQRSSRGGTMVGHFQKHATSFHPWYGIPTPEEGFI